MAAWDPCGLRDLTDLGVSARSRYDAEAVVAAFTSRLRQTVDLDAVRRGLVGVTQDAFQPVHGSMWLAPAPVGEAALEPLEQDRPLYGERLTIGSGR